MRQQTITDKYLNGLMPLSHAAAALDDNPTFIITSYGSIARARPIPSSTRYANAIAFLLAISKARANHCADLYHCKPRFPGKPKC